MRLIKILLVLQLIVSLNSCGPLAYKKVDARKLIGIQKKESKKILKKVEDLNFLIRKKTWLQLMSLLVQTNFGVQL
jgi:hypothetical protein